MRIIRSEKYDKVKTPDTTVIVDHPWRRRLANENQLSGSS